MKSAMSRGGDDATAELGDSYTHDSQVSRLIKDPSPPPKPPDAMKTSVFVLRGGRGTKQELDGSIAHDPTNGTTPSEEGGRAPSPKGPSPKAQAAQDDDHLQPYPGKRTAMSPSFALASKSPTWRRAGSSLALAASLAFSRSSRRWCWRRSR